MKPSVPLFVLALMAMPVAAKDVEVTRFHLGQPLAGQTIRVVPPPEIDATSLQYQAWTSAIAAELGRAGFQPVADGTPAALTATARIDTESSTQRRPSPFSVGIGGGSFGRGGGVGAGASFPVGGGSTRTLTNARLSLQIRSGDTVQWEGRASETVKPEQVNATVGRLARAMLIGFPGESGKTVKVKDRQLR